MRIIGISIFIAHYVIGQLGKTKTLYSCSHIMPLSSEYDYFYILVRNKGIKTKIKSWNFNFNENIAIFLITCCYVIEILKIPVLCTMKLGYLDNHRYMYLCW